MSTKRPNDLREQPVDVRTRPAKRSKASQACSTCRKHKTRCELLDTTTSTGPIQCHRCKVLNIECSFENSDIIILPKAQASSPSLSSLSNTANGTPIVPTASLGALGVDRVSDDESPPQYESPPSTSTLRPPAPLPRVTPDHGRQLKVEDLVPTPQTPWGLLSLPEGFDWSAAPMLAIQELTKVRTSNPHPNRPPDLSLPSILSSSKIAFLVDTFETRYRPWMNMPRSKINSPVLDLVRCTIASRHLDSVTRSQAAPRLQALLEATVLQPGNPSQSTPEFLEALLILSMWSPICGGGYSVPRDGRLLAMTAVDIAKNLGLERSAVNFLTRPANGSIRPFPNADPDYADRPNAIEDGRLWLAISHIEHMLLVGTNRIPKSMRNDQDRTNLEGMSAYSAEDSTDLRLALLRRLFDLTDTGLNIKITDASEIDTFHKDVSDTLSLMRWLHRLITPLPIISQLDSFCYNMLEVTYHVCRLFVLHNILREMRGAFDGQMPHKIWFQVQHNGVFIAHGLAGDALYSAEAVLVSFLSRPDLIAAGTVPDHYFLLITFAATFLIVANFAIYHLRTVPLNGHSERLLALTIERFNQAALSPDHVPARCARVIGELLGAWERKESRPPAMQPQYDYPKETPAPPLQPQNGNHHHFTQNMPPPSQASSSAAPGSNPWGELIDPDMFFDTTFWASFIDNLNQ
ncbi:hypothetical protein HGRIS_010172 [Hohenbuehelia grisea]|uniref:Zn(2)-C6 fungal-type domain-containing protein n=1 Tax=Hohenbuehelia grisea TaxID=104357 RepID=A0ABR3J3G1_9AGAR